jgi:hypothetical protein
MNRYALRAGHIKVPISPVGNFSIGPRSVWAPRSQVALPGDGLIQLFAPGYDPGDGNYAKLEKGFVVTVPGGKCRGRIELRRAKVVCRDVDAVVYFDPEYGWTLDVPRAQVYAEIHEPLHALAGLS